MLSDIFQAYFDCRRRKRRTPEALLWEQNFEKNCLQLCQEITAWSYQPDDYQLIYVTDPVMREIFVPTFRDRVVHHLLANWLRPQLEKIFLYDNYAGREGRGTLFGIRRAEKFMRQVTQNYQKPAYVLKLDIASYFRSIPKKRLWEKIVEIQDLSRSPKCSELNSEFYEGWIGMTETQGGGDYRSSQKNNFSRPEDTFFWHNQCRISETKKPLLCIAREGTATLRPRESTSRKFLLAYTRPLCETHTLYKILWSVYGWYDILQFGQGRFRPYRHAYPGFSPE